MGRIKSTLVKKTAEQLTKDMTQSFAESFDKNKKTLGATMPSKRIRNMIAGYISRLKRRANSAAAAETTETPNSQEPKAKSP